MLFYFVPPSVPGCPPIITISVSGTPVSLSENIKILGIVLDIKLSFNSRIANLSKSCFLPYSGSSKCFQDQRVSLVSFRFLLLQLILFGTSVKNNIRWLHRIQSTLASRYTTTRTNQHLEDVERPTLASFQLPY